jgi:hypothetical protein
MMIASGTRSGRARVLASVLLPARHSRADDRGQPTGLVKPLAGDAELVTVLAHDAAAERSTADLCASSATPPPDARPVKRAA